MSLPFKLEKLVKIIGVTNIVIECAGPQASTSFGVAPVDGVECIIMRKVLDAINADEDGIFFLGDTSSIIDGIMILVALHEKAHVASPLQDPFGNCR